MTIIAKYQGRCRGCGGAISAGQEIAWTRDSGAMHTHCSAARDPVTSVSAVRQPLPALEAPLAAGVIKLSNGSGYGCTGWTVGAVIKGNDLRIAAGGPPWLKILTADKEYVDEDGLSFGVGEDEGYLYFATARAATPDEYAAPEAAHNAALAKAAGKKDLAEIHHSICRVENWVPGENLPRPEGEEVPVGRQDLKIYGTGDSLIITAEWVYAMHLCGGDGDTWNGQFGCTERGWRAPADEGLAERVRAAALAAGK